MGLAMADVSIGHARVSAAAGVFDSQSNVLAWILACAAMLLALMAPALWNGFPLIFPDTGGYLDRPVLGTLGMGRSALYGLFLIHRHPIRVLAECGSPIGPDGLADRADHARAWFGRPALACARHRGSADGLHQSAMVFRPVDARHSISGGGTGALFAELLERTVCAVGTFHSRGGDRVRHSEPYGSRRHVRRHHRGALAAGAV